MKKYLSLFSIFTILFMLTGITTVSAQEKPSQEDLKVTEDFEVDFEKEFEGVAYPEKEQENEVKPLSWNTLPVGFVTIKKLAKGTTDIALKKGKITGTGKTKGKTLTTVTSATNSVKNFNTGNINKGKKKIAVGKFTATSNSTMKNTKGKKKYGSLTVHTATHQGKLYSKKSVKFGLY